jgi:preprotein translocase subunit SecD
MRTVAVMGVAAASALALSGCSADGDDAPASTGSFQVREVAVVFPMAQWAEQAGDADSAAKVLASAGLEGLLTGDEYVAMVDAGCPADPLPAEQAGWLCSQDESAAYLVAPAAVTADDVASAEAASRPDGHWEIRVILTDSGSQKLEQLTSEASSRDPRGVVAFVVDGQVESAPSVINAITGGSLSLAGDWTEEEAKALAASLVG